MPKIAVIGFHTLEQFALTQLSEGFDTELRERVSLSFFNDTQAVENSDERYDLFIVAERHFVSGLDFFMLKKSRTVVWIHSSSFFNKEDNDIEGYNTGGFQMMYSFSDLRIIRETLLKMLQSPMLPAELSTDLTGREKEVLREIASGKTNKEIADRLNISVNTVITHRKNISTKLGIKSVSGLSLYALMNGII